MKKLMYTRPDGGVSIVYPVAKETLEKQLGLLSDAEYEEHIVARSIPADATNVIEIEDADIPLDREFRNAWMQAGNKIDFDLEKAKNIQLDKIRAAREPKLKELDTQYMLALEKGLDTKDIVAAKQALRDITEPLKVLTPGTIEDIKNSYPEELLS